MWRWCRRNPALATVSGAFLLALVAGTIVSACFAIHARAETQRAINALNRESDALAKHKAALEETERLLDSVLIPLTVLEPSSPDSPRSKQQIAALASMERYVEHYRDHDDADRRAKVAITLMVIGHVKHLVGSKQDSMAAYEQSLAIQDRLAQEHPSVTHRRDLGVSYRWVGIQYSMDGNPEAALAKFEKSLATWLSLARENPMDAELQEYSAKTLVSVASLKESFCQTVSGRVFSIQAIGLFFYERGEHTTGAVFRSGSFANVLFVAVAPLHFPSWVRIAHPAIPQATMA